MSTRTFKKDISVEDARQTRMRNTIELRKNKTQEKIKKLRNLTEGEASGVELRTTTLDISRIPQLRDAIFSIDENVQQEATREFRQLLSIERNPPINEVIAAGVVPRFVEFLQRWQRPTLQFEACWALTNIASGTSEHTNIVVDNKATPIFIQLLSSPNDDVREQAVWALGNIAGDSPKLRDMVLAQRILEPLIRLLDPSTSRVTMLRNATWTLSNLCRGKPAPAFHVIQPALATLASLIYHTDDEVLTDACWALSYLSDGSNEKIQAVCDSGVCRRLVELLMHNSPQVQTPALRAVGNIVTGDDSQTQLIVNCGVLPSLLSLLDAPRKGLKKEACWTLSNITAGSVGQIQMVIDYNIFPALIHMLANEEFDIKKECAWALSNATSGGDQNQIMYLVSKGCIAPMVGLLDKPDPRVVTVSLEGIDNILKWGAKMLDSEGRNPFVPFVEAANGVSVIEDLQKHENHKIYQLAGRILETYFEAEAEDEDIEDVQQPAFSGGNLAFNFSAPAVGGMTFGAR